MNGDLLLMMLVPVALAASEVSPISIHHLGGSEIVMIGVPAGWTSTIVSAAEHDRFVEQPQRIVVNGGYFDALGQPDGLLINDKIQTGRLRHDSPYSGFVWADAGGAVHIASTATTPLAAKWAIQSGPVLVDEGRVAINRSTSVAQRSVIALRRGQVFVIRSGRIGLKELAEDLVTASIDLAINLDGGPSSTLQARVSDAHIERPGTAKVPYFLAFTLPSP